MSMIEKVPPPPPPAGWLDVLAESEAEIAAGLTVDGDAIVRELYAAADRLEASQNEHTPKATLAR